MHMSSTRSKSICNFSMQFFNYQCSFGSVHGLRKSCIINPVLWLNDFSSSVPIIFKHGYYYLRVCRFRNSFSLILLSRNTIPWSYTTRKSGIDYLPPNHNFPLNAMLAPKLLLVAVIFNIECNKIQVKTFGLLLMVLRFRWSIGPRRALKFSLMHSLSVHTGNPKYYGTMAFRASHPCVFSVGT